MSRLTAAASCLLLILTGGSIAIFALQSEAPHLTIGARVVRTLGAGESHAYAVALNTGQVIEAAVTSPATNNRVRLLGPTRAVLREMTLGLQGGGARAETLTFVADAAGNYGIEVVAPGKEPGGEYTLEVRDIRSATDADRLRADAEGSYWEAANLYASRGDANLRRAVTLFRESLSLWRTLGDRWFEGNVLNALGGTHRLLAENAEALDYYEQAVPLLRSTDNLRELASALNNIGAVNYSRGEVRKAFDYFNQSLDVARTSGDRQAESILLNNLGALHQVQGNYQAALDFWTEALALRRGVQDRNGEARTLNNLSLIFRLLGDASASKQAAEQALTLAVALDNRELRAASLNNLGTAERVAGELAAAEGHLQDAVALFRDVGDRRLLSATLNSLGELHLTQGRSERARTSFEQAFAEARASEERQREAYVLRNIGRLEMAAGEHAPALRYFDESVRIAQAIGDRENEAESLRESARALERAGDANGALARGRAALAIVESVRSTVVSPQFRTTYFSSKRPYYELYVDLLMNGAASSNAGAADERRHQLSAALEASERARARSLVDLLQESGITIRAGVDPELLDREESLRQKINVVESSRLRALSGKPDPQRVASLEQELDALFREYERAQSDIRARSPQYAALSQAAAVSVADIQGVLDPDTLLLEYMLGDERSYLWAVTSTSLVAHVLPNRATIEALARLVYASVAREDRRSGNGRRRLQDDAALRQARAELSRLLLAPVAAELGTRRLVIVADGALLYVPFTVLDSPATGTPARPLIVDHEIVHLPSVTSLLVMRRVSRPQPIRDGSIGIIADPVFSTDDVRVTRRVASAVAVAPAGQGERRDTRDLQRSATDAGIVAFPRLRFTRQEAEGIAALVPRERRLQALDFAASRETAMSESFGRRQILHFATHGLINSAHPELSGLVLSLVDAQGRVQDGFLRLNDIYNLRLQTELVVLSACQTALGKDIRGEGLIGLTRGFMHAGALRVMASLWNVEDRATAELMKRFYEATLVRGQAPAAALREAQLALLRDRRWSDPYYWGAFILQGEWQ